MSAIVAIGEAARVDGYALAGVRVLAAEDDAQLAEAWDRLPPEAGLLLLTPAAAAALEGRLGERSRLLWAVLP